MATLEKGKTVGIKALATYQGVSESYLSKMFTKLTKEGLIESVPGVRGGYALAKEPKEISFWDVVVAIEGRQKFFQCDEIRQREAHLDPNHLPDAYCKKPCLIKTVMWEGEQKMQDFLSQKTLAWLFEQVEDKVSQEDLQRERDWFEKFI